MAKSAITAQEFIQNAFSPTIAVLCSPSVEAVCKKNNLSFVQLIQPFCRINTEVYLRDPQNQAFAVRNLRIVLKNINWQCPSSQAAKSLLNNSVSKCFPGQMDGHNAPLVNTLPNNPPSNGSTPWFEAYRECFLHILPPSSHEFIGQYVACLMVASCEDTDPFEELRKLSQKQHENQHQSSPKTHRWFSPNTFKYHVLVHDLADGDLDRAQVLHGTLESTYGAHASHLLKINSKPLQPNAEPVPEADISQMPDPWSQFMTAQLDESQCAPEGSSAVLGNTQSEYEGKGVDEDLTVRHPLSEYLDDKEIETACDAVQDEDLNASVSDESTSQLRASDKTHSQGHGACLTVSDMDRLRIFVNEFCVRGLLPYVERQMRVLGEAVANRKGIPRSIFSATKKWFGGSKPTVPYTAAQANVVVYGPEALELQVRRLGDLAFMFQHHELAYQAYHMAKRDFTNDQAWLHCAGSQEMAAVSVFMLGSASPRPFPAHYLDSAINIYLKTCKSLQLATRCTLLSTECLKSLGRYAEAAGYFVRLTSEDSDLRSALLLEQAAHCYANLPTPHMRKFTFYLILAGHRYNKAGQRKHSLRTYKMAQQVFKGKGWHLAQDHVNLLTGRLNLNLGLKSEAITAYRQLLYEGSKQSASQQAFFVREFINTLNASEQSLGTRHKLPLPMIMSQDIKVLLGVHPTGSDPNVHVTAATSCSFDDDNDEESKWLHLEKTLIYDVISRNVPYAFRSSAQLYTKRTDNSKKPVAFAGEPIAMQIVFKNPLEIPLLLNDVHLIWSFKANSSEEEEVSNEQDDQTKEYPIITESIPEVTILAGAIAKVVLTLVPAVTGELNITGVAYRLGIQQSPNVDEQGTIPVRGMQNLHVQGPKVIRRESSPADKTYEPDFRLNLNVFTPMPRLGVNFYAFPTSIMCGELRELRMQLTNHSSKALSNLHLISTTPELFVLGPFSSDPSTGFIYTKVSKERQYILQSPPALDMTDNKLPMGYKTLEPGESRNISLWLRGPEDPGPRTLDLLFYYEDNCESPQIRHRVLRHKSQILVSGSVEFEATPMKSANKDGGLVLTIDVTNCNGVLDNNMTTVSVMQVSGVSDTWNISPIVKSSSSEGIVVGPKETVYICIKAKEVPISHEGTNLHINNVPLGDTEWDVTQTPCVDFYWRSVQKQSSLPIGNDEIQSANDTTFSATNNDIGLGLVILWKAFVVDDKGESRTAYGQHHIRFGALDAPVRSQLQPIPIAKPVLRFVPENPLPVQVGMVFPAEKLGNLVKASVRVPSRIHHNFNGDSVCVVDVQLELENRHAMNVQVVIDAGRVIDGTRAGYCGMAGSRTSPGSSFAWVGRSCTTMSAGPNETRVLSLRAAIFAPGVYNLSDMYIGARPSDHPHIEVTPQKGPGVYMVVVEDQGGVAESG